MTKTGATDKAIQIYGNADMDAQLCFKYEIQLTDDASHIKEDVVYFMDVTPATLIEITHQGIGYDTKVGKYIIQ